LKITSDKLFCAFETQSKTPVSVIFIILHFLCRELLI
jgi:hypothetical protein